MVMVVGGDAERREERGSRGLVWRLCLLFLFLGREGVYHVLLLVGSDFGGAPGWAWSARPSIQPGVAAHFHFQFPLFFPERMNHGFRREEVLVSTLLFFMIIDAHCLATVARAYRFRGGKGGERWRGVVCRI